MSSATPHDLVNITRRVSRELAAGLDISDTKAVAALARAIEPELTPRIIPDRRYTVQHTHSGIYGRRKHLIRKDHGDRSVILGRDLLADQEALPRLVSPVLQADGAGESPPASPRRPGRPRKNVASD
jgi:hypothetical protein